MQDQQDKVTEIILDRLEKLDEKLDDLQETLTEIKVQTTKTNGRVTHQEKEIEEIKEELKPLKQSQSLFSSTVKILLGISFLVGLAVSIKQLF